MLDRLIYTKLFSLMLLAATALSPQSARAAVACEDFAAVIDGAPIDQSFYDLLSNDADQLPKELYKVAPVTAGRYWITAMFADGIASTPYAHYGCFADVRVALAWACTADVVLSDRRSNPRGKCNWKRAGSPVELPKKGCLSMPLALRDRVMYCAAGSSPSSGAR